MEGKQSLGIPAAILLGAVIIAGAIIYVVNPPEAEQKAQKTAAELYQDIAKSIGISMAQFNDCVSQKKYTEKVQSHTQLGIQSGVQGTPATFVNGVALEGGANADLKTAIDEALKGKTGNQLDDKSLDMGHVRGNQNARVTIVEFSDLQCPFCRSFHPRLQQVLQDYGDEVRWVYEHFPLESIHPQAMPAAQASECVWEQKGDEGFWKFVDQVFANQEALD